MLMATIRLMTMIMSLKHEQIFFVIFVMSRNLPEVDVKHVRCDDLLVTSPDIFSFHQVNKAIVNLSTVRQKEGATRCQFVEKE